MTIQSIALRRVAPLALLFVLGCKTTATSNKCGVAWHASALVPALGAAQNTTVGNGAPSADGRFVAFGSASSTNYLVYLSDTCNGSTAAAGCAPKTVLVSADASGNAPANCFGSLDKNSRPAISSNGRYVAFASSLCTIAGSGPSGTWQIYQRDTCTGPAGPATVPGAPPPPRG
jgi:hypothetical protein